MSKNGLNVLDDSEQSRATFSKTFLSKNGWKWGRKGDAKVTVWS